MSITQSVWSSTTVNGFTVQKCTVLADSALKDAYTLKIPAGKIDGTRPFSIYQSISADPDGSSLPAQLWYGYSDAFVLSGDDSALDATDGEMYKQLVENCRGAVTTNEYVYYIHPDLGVADVVAATNIATGFKVNVPPAPYYALCLNGASTLNAVTTTWRVVQKGG